MLTVKLLSFTPEPEKTVAAAAKLCYSSASIDTLREKTDDAEAARFTEMLADIGHESPIEHVSFTFGIEGVSRALLAQITRHRIASYSVQSQRYVNEARFEYVLPPEIEKDETAKQIFLKSMEDARQAYAKLSTILAENKLAELQKQGVPEAKAMKDAEKAAIEDARFVLPNACATKLIVTMNARSLYNFFKHRVCSRAQWEIRVLAKEMLRLVLSAAPTLFSRAGPGCLSEPCPEGKMSCGKAALVKSELEELRKSVV